MKLKKLIAIILAVLLAVCLFVVLKKQIDKASNDNEGKIEAEESGGIKENNSDGGDENSSGNSGEENKPSSDNGNGSSTGGNNSGNNSNNNNENEDWNDGNSADQPSDGFKSDIKGHWSVDIGFDELMILGSEVSGNDLGMNIEKLADDIGSDAALALIFEFEADTVTFSIEKADIEKAAAQFCDDYLVYLKNGGLAELLEAQGHSYDDLLAELKDAGVTVDSYYEALENTLREQFDSLSSLARKSTTKYTLSENKIELQGGGTLTVDLRGDKMEIKGIENLSDANAQNALALFLDGKVLER